MSLRKIIHVDMDAFYASVEQRDNPALRGKPVAVGGSEKRGVVAAASYEARLYGVHSAMPGVTARRRCAELVFVKPRFEVYRAVSRQIRDIFGRYSDLVEPLSLDEAYLDVSADPAAIGSATQTAERIRAQIREELGLTASAGVSYNKFLAKVASDQNKPDGVFVVRPEEGADFVAVLPARRFFGVGPKTALRMAGLGIHTGADLRAQSLLFLETHFGKSAAYLYAASRAEDERPVRPNRTRKSVGAERTYSEDLSAAPALYTALGEIVDIVWGRIEGISARGRTVTLKVKYADFQQISRARSIAAPLASRTALKALGEELLASILPVPKGVRLLGLTLSSLAQEPSDSATGPAGAEVGMVSEGRPAQHSLKF